KLDAQISENPVVPYLTGVERDRRTSARNVSRSSASDPWGAPDFLRSENGNPDLPGAGGPPNPIDTRASTVGGIPIPRENAAWEPVEEAVERTNNTKTQPVSMPKISTITKDGFVIHRVQKGDTLSELAQRYLGSSARFGEIYKANRDQLRSPNDLRLGLALRIPQKVAPKSNRARRIETRPISIRNEDAPRTKPARTSVMPQKSVAPAASPKRLFSPARRSPLSPRGVGTRASGPAVPLDTVPRQLTQLPPESLKSASAGDADE
ncbi:MAG: LysM peptidoglycan-binding domain-containing protein, partial [Planctomycetaceae bacterium]|nr:LysM peptidoglycan-binding domain-containing protein [Planctomycetaceae bacterium]